MPDSNGPNLSIEHKARVYLVVFPVQYEAPKIINILNEEAKNDDFRWINHCLHNKNEFKYDTFMSRMLWMNNDSSRQTTNRCKKEYE